MDNPSGKNDPAYMNEREWEEQVKHCYDCEYYNMCDEAPMTQEECDAKELYKINESRVSCDRCPHYDCCDCSPQPEDECEIYQNYIIEDSRMHNL